MERLRRERELVGMYLSAHPLDPYYIEIKYAFDVKLDDLKNKMNELDKVMRFGGIITSYEELPTKRGDHFGKMTIEDFTGSYELALFGNSFREFRNYGIVGTPIMITGKFTRSKYNDRINLEILKMDSLIDVKGKLVNRIRIDLNESQIHDMQMLKTVVGKKAKVNNCNLYFRVYDNEKSNYVDLKSQYTLPIDRKLMELIDDMGLNYKVNF